MRCSQKIGRQRGKQSSINGFSNPRMVYKRPLLEKILHSNSEMFMNLISSYESRPEQNSSHHHWKK